jgi:hypothetical protein
MTKTQQILEIAKKVEDKVGTLTTINNLKQCLEECDVAYLSKDEWEELVSYLERYYIITNVEYPFEVIEAYKEDVHIN